MTKFLTAYLLALLALNPVYADTLTSNSFTVTIEEAESSAPAWFTSLADKTWSQVDSAGTLTDVAPSPLPGGTIGQSGVILAWTGGVVDTSREALILPANGGHGDYYGNEVYRLQLNTANPAWERLTTPSTAFGSGSAMSDGRPRSSHNTHQIAYDPGTDRVFLTGMQYYAPSGNSSGNMYAFNQSDNSWIDRAALPSGWGDNTYRDGGSVYDPIHEKIWIIACNANGTTSLYDPSTNTHNYLAGNYVGHQYNCAVALDQTARAVVMLNGNAGDRFSVKDADNTASGQFTSVTRTGSWPSGDGMGLAWSATTEGLIGWDGGATLYKFNAPATITDAWTVTSVSATSGTPGSKPSNGAFGKFNIINNFAGSGQDLIVNVVSLTQTFVYKIPSGGLL